jgi:uncharacterized Fe-S cluster-containing protein
MFNSHNHFETKCAKFSLLEDGILSIQLLANSEIDISESKLMQKLSLEITRGEKFVALIDAREAFFVSKESREWGSTAEAQKNMVAQAIVVNSLANRLIGNFIIQFHKPIAKTRLFSDEKSALQWLRDQKNNIKF